MLIHSMEHQDGNWDSERLCDGLDHSQRRSTLIAFQQGQIRRAYARGLSKSLLAHTPLLTEVLYGGTKVHVSRKNIIGADQQLPTHGRPWRNTPRAEEPTGAGYFVSPLTPAALCARTPEEHGDSPQVGQHPGLKVDHGSSQAVR